MKTKIILSACFAAFAALADTPPSGTFISYFGYNAGLNSTNGMSANFVGAYSGYNADGAKYSDFVGAMAGSDAKRVYTSEGVGSYALATSSNVVESVAIGQTAMYGARDSKRVVAVNTDFFKSGRGWTNNTAIGNALMTNHGDWYVTNGVDISGFDLVVAEYGQDSWDGRTLNTPKRTLDGAIAAVQSNGTRIAVLAGEYAYPAAGRNTHLPYSPEFVAVHGREKTRLVPTGEPNVFLHGADFGSNVVLVRWKGFTFVGINGTGDAFPSTEYRPAFLISRFEDCSFQDFSVPVMNSHYLFRYCVLVDCDLKGRVRGGNNSSLGSGEVFSSCELYGCVVSLATEDVYDTWPKLQEGTRFVNCYIEANHLYVHTQVLCRHAREDKVHRYVLG